MGFLGVYKALYDYAPQAEGELQISEGDLLYVLEKSEDDDWWKAKKKASDDDDDEPMGLIPSNYIEQSSPVGHARALYDYTRQTDEELSFPEDARLEVFDTSDPDWILVGHDGEYGFAPANYIELGDGEQHGQQEEDAPAPPSLPQRRAAVEEDDEDTFASPPLPARNGPSEPSSPAVPNPAAALAGVLGGRSQPQPPPALTLPPRPQPSYETEEERSPPLPSRPRGESLNASVEQAYRPPPPPQNYSSREDHYADAPQTPRLAPGGFHMYNINEMVSVMGKRKKMPTTLGINLKTGAILIAPERAADGPSQEWTADRITHYSREGKHVFMELVRPSKSVDFHAGAKDTAEEIVSALGELMGAVRAEGLKEVIAAGTGRHQKTGKMLYDFMAQGEDEVSVAVDDEVIVLDDTKSEEWWQVRRIKNGKEGVVPSSYVEITGTVPQAPSTSGINAGRSFAEQNRLEEERLTKEAVKAARREEQQDKGNRSSTAEVGPGMRLPERNSSLSASSSGNNVSGHQQRSSKRENGASGSSSKHKTKPDPSKVRTWTDRSKSFSVEAQFLGLKDGKLNLHKLNGVKIAVPIAKMSLEDLEYVERVTGISLDEDKPLSELKKRSDAARASTSTSRPKAGASVEPEAKQPEYDWFQFFLSCGVNLAFCERYAQAFNKDSIDESVLPDIDASVLRNLGIKEGDIIKIMRFLDNKYGRQKKGGEDGEGSGGLFSGPGGTLRNNTRKGRPAPAVATSDTVDASAFSVNKNATGESTASPTTATPPAATPTSTGPAKAASSGFDDDAWDVKPSKTRTPEPAPQEAPKPAPVQVPAATAPTKPVVPQLTGAMQDLSLLTFEPLQPVKVQTAAPPAPALQPQATAPAAPTPAQVPQPTGATPAFFTGMQPPVTNGQQAGQFSPHRQRPLAPQYTQGQGALMPPPPARPLSAPLSAQQSSFTPPPLQPQMTGNPTMYQQPGQQMAPPGQSLAEINQARMQQQYAQQMQQQQQMMQQPTGMMGYQQPQPTGFGQPQPTGFQQPQSTGFGAPPNQFQPGMMNVPGQFGMMPQPTGFQTQQTSFQPQPTGFQPQQTVFQPQPTGFGQPPQQQPAPFMPQPTGLSTVPSTLPPLVPQQTGHFTQGFGNAPGPLVPQQTGPPPPVRFGVTPETKRLAPQATGRKANLAAATPNNPFGF